MSGAAEHETTLPLPPRRMTLLEAMSALRRGEIAAPLPNFTGGDELLPLVDKERSDRREMLAIVEKFQASEDAAEVRRLAQIRKELSDG